MENILNDMLIMAGEIGSIVLMSMNDEYIEMKIKAKTDGTIYDFYVTKKEEEKDA